MPDSFTQIDLIAAILSYFLGSIPFGLVLTKLTGAGDLLQIGSGNIGATNVLRTGRKGLAAATLILDGGKGAVAALIAHHTQSFEVALIAGLFAVLGHNFPIWLKFKGGKGVATSLGVLLAISWPTGLCACATWLLVAWLFRYSSLAALVGLAVAPIYAWWLVGPQEAWLALILAVLIFIRHHANIRRLINGEESRIGEKK